MKKILAFISFLLPFISDAAVHTVSNSVLSPGQFNTITAAIGAAAAGDTLYVHGTANSYGSIVINKSLVFIGTGHHPDKQLAYTSFLSEADILASDVVFDGFVVNTLDIGMGVPVSNVIVRNCNILWTINMAFAGAVITNVIFENNILWGGNFHSFAIQMYNSTSMMNVVIRNNIFHNRIVNGFSPITIDHNLFYTTGFAEAFSNLTNAMITNNIFYVVSPQGAGTSTFNNNLTYNTLNNTLPYGSNSGSGNLIGDPQFINYPPAGETFQPAHNYNVQSSSPAAGSATDSSDLGPEGGVGFSMTGEPQVPVIRSLEIQNPNVPAGGFLNVRVVSTKAE